jgi:Lrp/AsnC family leucine-responsive transcriptional regulator
VELDQFIGELQEYGRTNTLIVFSTSVEHRGVVIDPSYKKSEA